MNVVRKEVSVITMTRACFEGKWSAGRGGGEGDGSEREVGFGTLSARHRLTSDLVVLLQGLADASVTENRVIFKLNERGRKINKSLE